MKIIRKEFVIILSVILIMITVLTGILLLKNNSKQSISTILSRQPYAYLPMEAKEYIEKVYEETGELILTEKNKEVNEPYLNPKYIEYLELSDDEKENVELIPDIYVLDYEVNKSYSTQTLPSSYDLRDVNGKNYISDIKNQGTTEICWAFASIENVETLLMQQKNQSYSDQFQKFSIRQLDYATSTDYLVKDASWISCSGSCTWISWGNAENGSRSLGKGGNFFTSSIIMSNALSLTDENILPWTEENNPKWPKDIIGYDKSLYEVNSTIQMPTINEDSASEELINSYVNDVKNYIIQYGGPFVGTYSPKSTCGFNNTDDTKAIRTDDCVNDTYNRDQGHAMQIIGWDDNYEYSYCDAGTKHYSVNNDSCTSGQLIQGKGAWILRNSWGEESEDGMAYKYVYLTYDSTRLSVGFTTSISEMANKSWDNNYHGNPWIEKNISNGMASVSEQTKEFDTHNTKSEKIEKIKFVTASKNGKYILSIIVGDNEYSNVAVVNSSEVGIYTVDLSDKNIIIDDNSFSVKIVGEDEDKFYNNSLSVFTSNVDPTPMVTTYSTKAYDSTKPLSDLNPLYVKGDNYWYLAVNTYLKNIPSNSNLTYRVQKDGVIATERQIADFKKIIINDYGEANFAGSYSSSTNYFSTKKAYGNTYTFEILYGDVVVDSFPVKFSGKGATTKSNVRLYANNGTDYYYDVEVTDKTTSTFKLSSINSKDFYNNGYYITGWNTKADGTGESYGLDEAILIYHDIVLYAQWSNETFDVKFSFKCKYSDNCGGTMNSITVNINDNIAFPENNFTMDGYKFTTWVIDNQNYYYELHFYEQEKRTVSSLLGILQNLYNKGYFVFNNMEIEVYAYWSNSSKTITFDSNGGSGNMKSINLEPTVIFGSVVNYRIKDNLFTRDGYVFTGWNTEANGNGTSYTSTISIEDDMTLYAQWEINQYTITFNSNGGLGSMMPQQFLYNTSTNLKKNTFTKDGFKFVGWNTEIDGTGTSYTDEQSVMVSSNLTLYAQWEINQYTITFNSNGGLGSMMPQQFLYNTSTNLKKNTFTKDGFKFVGWNTEIDGTGVSYTDEQSVMVSSNLTLYAQWSEGQPYVINEYNYDKEGNYIVDIDVNTTVEQYIQHVVLLDGYTVDVDYKTINDEQLLYTGGKTRIYRNQMLYAELTNVVSGDTNGDGKINYLDYVNVYNHIQKTKHPESNKNLLVDEYLLAADMSKDSKISYLDYVRIYNKIKELKGGTN